MSEIMPVYDSIERHEVEWYDEDENAALDAHLEQAERKYWASHRIVWDEDDRPFIIEDAA